MATSVHPGSIGHSLVHPFDHFPPPIMEPRQTPQGDTITVAPTIQHIRKQIIQDLSQRKSFSATCLDYLLGLLANELSPSTLKIMNSEFLVMGMGANGISDLKADNFLTPIYHTADTPHWTLISVSKECEGSSNRPYFRALHYDSQPDRQRNADVEGMLNLWKERHYGRMELRFGRITGPTHEQRYMSGRFVIIAAIEFARSGTINFKKTQNWDFDPGKLIMDLLNGKRAALSQEPSQFIPNDTPSKNPKAPECPRSAPSGASAKKPFNPPPYKLDFLSSQCPQTPDSSLKQHQRVSAPPTGSRQVRGFTPLSSTRRMAKSLRKRVDLKRHQVKDDKPINIIVLRDDDELPTEDSLIPTTDRLIHNFRDKKKRVEDEHKALYQVEELYTIQEMELKDAIKEHGLAQATVDKKLQAKDAWIKQCHILLPGFEDMEVDEDTAGAIKTLEATMDKAMSPERAKLKDKSARKRKANDDLITVGDKRMAQQAQVKRAKENEESAEFQAQQACKEEVKAVLIDDHMKESARLLQEKLKKYDNEQEEAVKEGKWLENFEKRRRQRHKE